jgi:hypothetical protein
MTGENEEVLSQPETESNSQGTPPEKKQEKSPEQKRHDYEMAARRLSMKNWRQEAAEEGKKARDAAVRQVAKQAGFDENDADNKKQVDFIANSISATRDAETQAERKVLANRSSEWLADTFKQLDIEPSSQEALAVGNTLFKKYGVNDPEKYSDPKLIEQEMENLAAKLSRKKPDPIKEEAMRKSGAPKGSAESRAGEPGVRSKIEAAELSRKWGVSKERADKISKLRGEAEKSVWAR